MVIGKICIAYIFQNVFLFTLQVWKYYMYYVLEFFCWTVSNLTLIMFFFFFNSFKQIIQHNLCVYLSSVSKVTLILLQRTAVDTLDSHPATATSSLVSQRLNYVLLRVCVLHLQAEHWWKTHTHIFFINIHSSHQIICRVKSAYVLRFVKEVLKADV